MNGPTIKRKPMMKQICVPIILFALLLIPVTAAEEIIHVLKRGETLYGISRQYKVSPDALMKFNDITDPSRIREGQKIRIPDVYTIKKGDTLFGIARAQGVSVSELTRANGLTEKSSIKAGNILYIPAQQGIAQKSTSTTKTTALPALESESASSTTLVDPRIYKKKSVDASLIWPVKVREIAYLSGKLYGVSILSDKGEQVKAIASGTIISTGPYRGFGQVVFVQSKTGHIYVYGGLEGLSANPGQTIAFGEQMGTLGSDSLSGKPQLYFMVYNKDVPVDPAKAPRGY